MRRLFWLDTEVTRSRFDKGSGERDWDELEANDVKG
jgi:hypothetical protein